jgi:DNA-binding ferritin-like protein
VANDANSARHKIIVYIAHIGMGYEEILALASTLEAVATKRKPWSKKPHGWKQKSVKQYSKTMMGGEKHPFSECVKKMKGHVDNPEGFCASVKDIHKDTKKWRSTDKLKKKKKAGDGEKMRKFAQSSSPTELMSLYTAFLRALYLIHQRNHWETKGYDLHLMFQRIYEGAQEMSDEAAEKTIGVFKKPLVGQDVIASITKKYYSPGNPVASSLAAEKDFQALAKKTYDALKDSGEITLGLDDMIMAHHSKSELHTYLLQLSMKE